MGPVVSVVAQLADEVALGPPEDRTEHVVPRLPHQLEKRRDVPVGRRLVADQWVVNELPQRGGVDPLRLDRRLDLAVDEGAEPRLEQLERLADPFVIGCRHAVRESRPPGTLCFPGSSGAWRVVAEFSEEGKSSGFTAMVLAVLLRSQSHPGLPSPPDGACSISSATAVSNRRTTCTNAPRPATARRAARRTSHTTRRLSAEPVVPPPVQAPKVSCPVPRPSGRLFESDERLRAGQQVAFGAPGQACSTSNAARLRASLLNSTPIRWIGSPRSRYLSA